jgi:hypothetical protein
MVDLEAIQNKLTTTKSNMKKVMDSVYRETYKFENDVWLTE